MSIWVCGIGPGLVDLGFRIQVGKLLPRALRSKLGRFQIWDLGFGL